MSPSACVRTVLGPVSYWLLVLCVCVCGGGAEVWMKGKRVVGGGREGGGADMLKGWNVDRWGVDYNFNVLGSVPTYTIACNVGLPRLHSSANKLFLT